MPEVNAIIAALASWEGAAAALAIAYLILAAREHIACWWCALASTAIYAVLLWNAKLPMQAVLNGYYLLMAVYGWYQWRNGGSGGGVVITRWPWRYHLLVIAAVAVATAVNGYALATHTAAAWPYLDAFLTWGAVLTTFMVTKKILENWIYWFVLDGLSIPLYLERGLSVTAGLFAVYLVIVVFGYLHWRGDYFAEQERAR